MTAAIQKPLFGGNILRIRPNSLLSYELARTIIDQQITSEQIRKESLIGTKEVIDTFRVGDRVKLTFLGSSQHGKTSTGKVVGYKYDRSKDGWKLIINIEETNAPKLTVGNNFGLIIDLRSSSRLIHFTTIFDLSPTKLEAFKNGTGDTDLKNKDPNWRKRERNGIYKTFELEKLDC